jgi:hypothetical protein
MTNDDAIIIASTLAIASIALMEHSECATCIRALQAVEKLVNA